MPRKPKPAPPPKRHERTWGAGTVTTLPSGKHRAFRARVHNPDGTSTRPSRTFVDRAQAEAWARGDVEPDVLYLGAWLERWLTLRLPTVGPRAQIIYRRYVEACEPIAAIPLANVTTDVLQAHINALLGRWARTYVATWRSVMSGAFAAAVPRYITHNPMRGTRLPKAVETPPKAWSAEEVARLVEAARGRVHETWLWLSLGTGIRLGEARALLWADLDAPARTISISKSMDQETGEVGPTKGRRTRTVDVPDEVMAVLLAHKLRQRPGEKRVVATVIGRLPSAKAIRRWLVRLCARIGVTVLSPHACRHTAASLMIAAGVPIPEVARALGHSSPALTLRVYAHVVNAESRRGATALGAALVQSDGPNRANGADIGSEEAR